MDGRMLWKEGIYGKKGEMEASKLLKGGIYGRKGIMGERKDVME